MVSEPASGNTEELTFRRVTGKPDRAVVAVDSTESRVGEFLIARWIWLDDRTELRQLRVIPGPGRSAGYERLDNEILAGRRLHEVTEGVGYPPVLSHLYGDEAESADPYALLEPYRGEPLHAVVGQMMKAEQLAFEISLLTGLCWLEAAGIAHRGLSPSTVRWDGRRQQAQITDFSLATVFRVPREEIGPVDWVGPEQRPGEKVSGLVTERDDMHAAGLIYYVRSQGEQLQSGSQLAGEAFADLGPLFGQPDRRPTARALSWRGVPVWATRSLAGSVATRGSRAGTSASTTGGTTNTLAFPGQKTGAVPGAAPPRAHRTGWLRPGCRWNPREQVRWCPKPRRLGHRRIRTSAPGGDGAAVPDGSPMSTLDQIIYRAPSGARGIILQAAASLQDPGSGDLWLRRLEPWLRAGGPLGRGYLNFGPESALIRWHDNTTSGIAWQFAHAVVGPSDVLTGSYALLLRELPAKLPSLPPDDRPLQVVDTDRIHLSHPGVIGARSRSKEAIELLVPLLARVLAGEQRVIMPWTEWSLPEAVVWGLVSILDMLGDARPLSYLTYAPGQAETYPGCTFRSVPGPPRCRQTRGSRRWPSAWRPVTPTTPPDSARCFASTEYPEKPTTHGGSHGCSTCGSDRISMLATSRPRL